MANGRYFPIKYLINDQIYMKYLRLTYLKVVTQLAK